MDEADNEIDDINDVKETTNSNSNYISNKVEKSSIINITIICTIKNINLTLFLVFFSFSTSDPGDYSPDHWIFIEESIFSLCLNFFINIFFTVSCLKMLFEFMSVYFISSFIRHFSL